MIPGEFHKPGEDSAYLWACREQFLEAASVVRPEMGYLLEEIVRPAFDDEHRHQASMQKGPVSIYALDEAASAGTNTRLSRAYGLWSKEMNLLDPWVRWIVVLLTFRYIPEELFGQRVPPLRSFPPLAKRR